MQVLLFFVVNLLLFYASSTVNESSEASICFSEVSALKAQANVLLDDNVKLDKELSNAKLSNNQQLISFETRSFEQQEKLRLVQSENSKLHTLLNENRRAMKLLQAEYSQQVIV